MDHREQMVEVVARAICVSDGFNPDQKHYEVDNPDRLKDFGSGDYFMGRTDVPRWTQYRTVARRQIAAFEAIREHLRMTGKQF